MTDFDDLVVESNDETLPFLFKERIKDMVPDYPNNSDNAVRNSNQQLPDKSTGVRREVDRTIKSTGTIKKRNRQGVLGILFEKDFKEAKDTIITEIIKPKIKDAFFNVIDNGLRVISDTFQTMIFENIDYRRGYNSIPRRSDQYSYNNGQYNYNSISQKRIATTSTGTLRSRATSNLYNYDDLLIDDEAEANEVVCYMQEEIATYGQVSVAQMYQFANMTPPRHTDYNWGWYDISGVNIDAIDCGQEGIKWEILLPRAQPLR